MLICHGVTCYYQRDRKGSERWHTFQKTHQDYPTLPRNTWLRLVACCIIRVCLYWSRTFFGLELIYKTLKEQIGCGNVCTSTRQHARFCEVSPSLLFSSSRFLRLSILGQRPMGVQSMLLPFLFSGSFTILLFRRNIVKTAKALAASGGNSGGNSAAAWVLFWLCCVLGYTWLCRFSPRSAKALVKVEPSTYAAFTSHKFSAYRHSWIVYSSPVPSSGDSPEFSE